jgi:hypothetical protein
MMVVMKRVLQPLQRFVGTGLVVMLFSMVAMTFVDVLGRRLFNTPVFGANDITEPHGCHHFFGLTPADRTAWALEHRFV